MVNFILGEEALEVFDGGVGRFLVVATTTWVIADEVNV